MAKSLPLFYKNWLVQFPMPIVIFFTPTPSISEEAIRKIVSSVSRYINLKLVPIERDDPPFVKDLNGDCICCCNGLKDRTSGLLGGPYHPDYCYMNRFRTLELYRSEVLGKFDYFVQLDTDLYIKKTMPYDPIENMTAKDAVFGFAQQGELPTPNSDCNLGLYDAIDSWITQNSLEPKYRPPLGRFYAGNFNIGSLKFLRSSEYYTFANWINNNQTGIWTKRWGDQAFLPNIIGVYNEKEKVLHFNDLHDEGYVVHESKSIGRIV